jgi:hypothetical protein
VLSSYRSTRTHQPVAGPVRLRIPSINVYSGLEELRRAPDQTIEVPRDPASAGGGPVGPSPGQVGASVILGTSTLRLVRRSSSEFRNSRRELKSGLTARMEPPCASRSPCLSGVAKTSFLPISSISRPRTPSFDYQYRSLLSRGGSLSDAVAGLRAAQQHLRSQPCRHSFPSVQGDHDSEHPPPSKMQAPWCNPDRILTGRAVPPDMEPAPMPMGSASVVVTGWGNAKVS